MSQYGRFTTDRDGNIIQLKEFRKYEAPALRLGDPVDLVIFTDEPLIVSSSSAVKPIPPVVEPYDPKNPERNYPGYL